MHVHRIAPHFGTTYAYTKNEYLQDNRDQTPSFRYMLKNMVGDLTITPIGETGYSELKTRDNRHNAEAGFSMTRMEFGLPIYIPKGPLNQGGSETLCRQFQAVDALAAYANPTLKHEAFKAAHTVKQLFLENANKYLVLK